VISKKISYYNVNISDLFFSTDMVALPEYPDDAVPHWGLPIFRETRLLFKSSSVTEQAKQTIALLIAKQFAEFVSNLDF
jgi:aminopeptidase N